MMSLLMFAVAAFCILAAAIERKDILRCFGFGLVGIVFAGVGFALI